MADHIAYTNSNPATTNLVQAAWFNSVNNAVYRGVNSIYFTTTGSANAQVLTITGAAADFTTLTAGSEFTFVAGYTNTAAMTLQVITAASNAAASVKTSANGTLPIGSVVAGGVYKVVWTGTVFLLIGVAVAPPSTRQVFLTGVSQTYTTPIGCRQIFVRMKAGGGGGGGSADATANGTAGSDASNSSFNSITVVGGGGGRTAAAGQSQGGVGGTGGTGTASVRISGADGGQPVTNYATATNAFNFGGQGGGQGGGCPVGTSAGRPGKTNTGSGGAGGSSVTSVAFASMSALQATGGGGEGEYAELLITAPAASYVYTVGPGGTGGAAGTNGAAGGAGGAGFIIVDEYY